MDPGPYSTMEKRLALFLALCVFAGFAFAQQTQTQPQTANDYFQVGLQAFDNKDYAAYVKNLQTAFNLGATHPIVVYKIAGGYALQKDVAQSVQWLNRLADWGLSEDPGEDPDFAAIKDAAEFQAVLKRFQSNLNPTANSSVAFTVSDKNLIPEGVTYDAGGKVFYLGSNNQRKIVSTDATGKVQDFATEKDGLWSVLGMNIDPARHVLWASSSAMEEVPGMPVAEKGRAGLFQYDLKTKKLLGKYLLPGDHKLHVLGDVIVNRAGDAYATDSVTPAIYRVLHGKSEMEQFLGPDLFRSPQGLCLSADEKQMFVADYVRGIFVIDMGSRAGIKLDAAKSTTTLVGIDGLYCYKDSLVATQNGVEPNRVIRIFLNEDHTAVERVSILESNNKLFGEVTLGTVVGDTFYYVANNQLEQKVEAPETELHPAVILKLPL